MKIPFTVGRLIIVGLATVMLGVRTIQALDTLRINEAYVQATKLTMTTPAALSGTYFPSSLAEASKQSVERVIDILTVTLAHPQQNNSAAYGLGRLLLQTHDFLQAYQTLEGVTNGRAELALGWKMWAWEQSGVPLDLESSERIRLGANLAQRARQFLVTARRKDSLMLYEVASRVAPEILDTWLDRIELYANEWDKRIHAYKQAAQLFPDNPYILVAGAHIQLYALGNRAEAQALINQAAEKLKDVDVQNLSRTRIAWLYYRYIVGADLALEQGDRNEAINLLEKAALLPNVSLDQGASLLNLTKLSETKH